LHAAGLDPAVDWLPIAPAAHYLSGGVVTDLDGASALAGLWAVGEVACTGVHGANRLASNSLLEGMVFGARLAEAIGAGRDGCHRTGVMRALAAAAASESAGAIPCVEIDDGADGEGADVDDDGAGEDSPHTGASTGADVAKLRERLQRAMTDGAGVLRSPASLAAAAASVAEVAALARQSGPGRAGGELANLVTVSGALLRGAFVREETRGAHARRDFPEARAQWRRRIVHRGVATPGTLAPGATSRP